MSYNSKKGAKYCDTLHVFEDRTKAYLKDPILNT